VKPIPYSDSLLVGLGRLGVPAVLQMVEVVRTIDFHTVPV